MSSAFGDKDKDTSYIGPVMKGIIDACTKELKKKEVKDKIMKNIIDPVGNEIFRKYSKYIMIYMLMQFMIIALLIYIAYSIRK